MNGRLLSAVLGVSCPQSPIREFRATSVGVKGILHKICYEVPLHHMATKLVSFSAFSLAFFTPSFSFNHLFLQWLSYRILVAFFNVGT